MLYRGQKVFYIKSIPSDRCDCHPWIVYPKLNDEATISGFFITVDGDLNLKLDEFPEEDCEHYYEGWDAKYWRPVVKKETDISTLKEMLNTKDVKENA